MTIDAWKILALITCTIAATVVTLTLGPDVYTYGAFTRDTFSIVAGILAPWILAGTLARTVRTA